MSQEAKLILLGFAVLALVAYGIKTGELGLPAGRRDDIPVLFWASIAMLVAAAITSFALAAYLYLQRI